MKPEINKSRLNKNSFRLFVGVGHGFLVTTIYTVEVSSKEFRGSFSIFEGVLRSIGLILVFCFGALIPWYQIAYFAPVFPLLAFLLLLNSPESPVFLVSCGKIEEAEASIGKLKHKDYAIKREIENISFGLEEQKQSHNGEASKLDILRNIGKYPEIYKPFLIVMILSIVQQFSGATVIRGFVVKIFGKVFLKPGDNTLQTNKNGTYDCGTEEVPMISRLANLSAILIAVVRLFASLILAKLLVKIPRRSLYAASAVGTVLSLAFFATTLLISDHAVPWQLENSEDLLNWSSVMSACLLVFSVNMGVQPMPLLMSSELFPAEVRALCKVISIN
jgi:facilitated trehalose transporter